MGTFRVEQASSLEAHWPASVACMIKSESQHPVFPYVPWALKLCVCATYLPFLYKRTVSSSERAQKQMPFLTCLANCVHLTCMHLCVCVLLMGAPPYDPWWSEVTEVLCWSFCESLSDSCWNQCFALWHCNCVYVCVYSCTCVLRIVFRSSCLQIKQFTNWATS